MKRFDKNGMLIIPTPDEMKAVKEAEELLVVKECYCQNGHNLVSNKVIFNDLPGILLKVTTAANQAGTIALSPVYGQKQRISLDVELINNEKVKIFCPHCDVELPVFANCTSCNRGQFIALYLDDKASFNNCLAVCNTIGCKSLKISTTNDILKEIRYLIS